ncbi:MAG: 2-dehydro-3-deoxyphosphogluconate aldolase [Oscillospiraceae bacterium]|nr:2-dehydro-3-deoxyphosphogluconate aldolase [Oscillospiraceae bacterium]
MKETDRRIREEKLIAILRGVHGDDLLFAAEVFLRSGIRLIELPFDRTGAFPAELTAAEIALLCSRFPEALSVGAGTVLTVRQAEAAIAAGAEYIISPNTDTAVIRRTKELGAVSIPGALTPTEAAAAASAGADFVKIFPADAFLPLYVKAIAAPLAGMRFLAVGGVNAETIASYLKAGYCGAGVGSCLADRKLIAARDEAALSALAARYVRAVREAV